MSETSKRFSGAVDFLSVGRADRAPRMKGLRPQLLQAAVSRQLRIPSLIPSQAHLYFLESVRTLRALDRRSRRPSGLW